VLKFIQKYINFRFLVSYFLVITITLFLSPYIIGDIQNFNLTKFFVVFALNLLPYIVLFIYGFKIRLDLDNSIQPGNYLVTVILGSLYIGLWCLPFLMIFLYLISSLYVIDANNLNETNFIINIIYLPVFYPIFIFSTGAYSRVLSNMKVVFKIKEVFYFFKMPFIKTIIVSSFFIYALPLFLKIISYKLSYIPFFYKIIYCYLQMLSFLLETYLVMYLIVLWDEVKFNEMKE